MEDSAPIAHVLRAVRYDTIQARVWCPMMQARYTTYLTPMGVWCNEDAKNHIVDWCELHADGDRLKLVTYDFMRDEYGRMIADLADIQSGEVLSEYLLQVGAATLRPHHLMEALHSMLDAKEVDDAGG